MPWQGFVRRLIYVRKACLIASGALFWLAAASGCRTTNAWEHETLARPSMAPDDDPDRGALRGHVLGIREGAQGGLGDGGGGCGCN